MLLTVIAVVGLFIAGVLAGEEFVMRYGVHPSLQAMDERTGIRARQQLILRLRWLVPVIYLPALALAVVVGVLSSGTQSGLRWAAVAAYAIWLLTTALGTVPINSAIPEWDAAAPPADSGTIIRRWARLDVLRSTAAIFAFALLLAATAVAAG